MQLTGRLLSGVGSLPAASSGGLGGPGRLRTPFAAAAVGVAAGSAAYRFLRGLSAISRA